MKGDINCVYPSVLKLRVNFYFLGFLVFSNIFSTNMNYFCNWEKSNEYCLKDKKNEPKDTFLMFDLNIIHMTVL